MFFVFFCQAKKKKHSGKVEDNDGEPYKYPVACKGLGTTGQNVNVSIKQDEMISCPKLFLFLLLLLVIYCSVESNPFFGQCARCRVSGVIFLKKLSLS